MEQVAFQVEKEVHWPWLAYEAKFWCSPYSFPWPASREETKWLGDPPGFRDEDRTWVLWQDNIFPNQWAASYCNVLLGLKDLFSGIFGYVCNKAGLVAIISIIIISHLCLPTSLNLCSQLERVKRLSPPIAIATAGLWESKTDYYESSSGFFKFLLSFLVLGKQ